VGSAAGSRIDGFRPPCVTDASIRPSDTIVSWVGRRLDAPSSERLQTDRIDLGAGNRTLVPNGRLHPTYRITYPRSLDASG